MKLADLRQTSLRTRLIFGMGAMLMPLVILAGGALYSLESGIGSFEKLEEQRLEELFPIADLESRIIESAIPVKAYQQKGDPSDRDRFVQLSKEIDRSFAALIATSIDEPEKKALLRLSMQQWNQAQKNGQRVLNYTKSINNLSATQAIQDFQANINQTVSSLDQLYKLLTHLQIIDNLEQAKNIKQRVRLIVIVGFGLGLGIASVASVILLRSILIPLHRLEKGVIRFGEGDFAHKIVLDKPDELGQLATAFNVMAEKLEYNQTALKNLASIDELTSVYNRREFNQRITQELERSRHYDHACTLLLMDIDHFKRLNDTYGHQVGDEVLRAIAALMKQEVRTKDWVARYGGEEFAVILPETSDSHAWAVAERLRQAIGSHLIAIDKHQPIKVTISGGLATFPQDGKSEEALIFAADQALYKAKHSGRDRVISSSSVSLE